MKRKNWASICLLMVFLMVSTNDGFGQEQITLQRTVTVRGEASHKVIPDEATVNFSIVTRSADANLARQLNAEAATRAIHAIEDAGVPSKSIKLQNLVLAPARRWIPETREYEELGFDVTRSVEVILDDLELAADVVTRVVASGANRLDGVRYGLKSDNEIRTLALTDAVAAAKVRAAAMVMALGAELGEVLTIKEEGISVPTPYVRAEHFQLQKAMSDESEAMPAGELEVSATVVVSFSIK